MYTISGRVGLRCEDDENSSVCLELSAGSYLSTVPETAPIIYECFHSCSLPPPHPTRDAVIFAPTTLGWISASGVSQSRDQHPAGDGPKT